MRNVMKAATLESKFPILSVEHDCIISKDADITVAYRVELPELFTVTQAEYEAIHSAWAKAVKVLPNYNIVHKQDFFIEESYTPELTNEARAEASSLDYALQGGRRQSQLQKEDLSFLSRSFERHFNERPYLKHYCYLFLTKTTKEHSRTTSSFNALTRGFIIPKEMQDRGAVSRFLEYCEQFERIINDSGFITLTRLTGDEITGTESSAGIFIPGSMEASAAKEMAANLGQNLGTSISITNQSAGDQLLSEVGRGAIQGVSQYISKKMREEKVHLKSGYTLMLYQNNQ